MFGCCSVLELVRCIPIGSGHFDFDFFLFSGLLWVIGRIFVLRPLEISPSLSLVRVSQLTIPLNVQSRLKNKNKFITLGFLVQSVKQDKIDDWTTFF